MSAVTTDTPNQAMQLTAPALCNHERLYNVHVAAKRALGPDS